MKEQDVDKIGLAVALVRLTQEFKVSANQLSKVTGLARSTIARRVTEYQDKDLGAEINNVRAEAGWDNVAPGDIVTQEGHKYLVWQVHELGVNTVGISVGVAGMSQWIDDDDIDRVEPYALPRKSKPKAKTAGVKARAGADKPKRQRKSRAKPVAGDVPDAYVGKSGDETDPEAPQVMITPTCVVVARGGVPVVIDKSHQNFAKIEAALKAKNYQLAYELIDLRNSLSKWSNGRVKIEGHRVTLDNNPVHSKLQQRMVDQLADGDIKSVEKWAKFIEKAESNPSFRVVTRIYDFMQAMDITIDDDGDIRAFKVVRDTYYDKHSNTMDNSPGLTVSMPRNKVNDKDEETCSYGLHVCSKRYFSTFYHSGDRVVEVKVNPTDWVSVPTDYKDSKARVCKYIVVRDVSNDVKPGSKAKIKDPVTGEMVAA